MYYLLLGTPFLASATTSPLEDMLTDGVAPLFTQILAWFGTLASTILSSPLLAIGFYVLVISFTVGLFIRIAGSR